MVQSAYESLISEWGALEAIVLQQDREINAANMARYKLYANQDRKINAAKMTRYKLCIAARQKDQRSKHCTNLMPKQGRKINVANMAR